jgi:RHS repeat-associated protein
VRPDFARDALGRLTATATRETEHRFAHNPVGQLVDERVAYAPGPVPLPGQGVDSLAAFTLTHAYDELGNRIQSTLPNGRRVDTLRYGSGHWHGTLWQGKAIVDLERDHLHRETVRELGGACERLTERRSYDPQSRLSGFTLDQNGQRLRERRYEYDATGNLVHIDDKFGGGIRYTYDPLGQLLSAVQPGLTETFAFDPAGNLLDPDSAAAPIELDEQPAPGTQRPRLAKVTHNLLRQYMGYAYEYDVRGNTVVKRPRVATTANEEGVLTFTYDAENRLTTAVRTFATSRMVARYSYDAFGRRIAKRIDEQHWPEGEDAPPIGHAHTGQLTLFVWDGDVMVQEIEADRTITYLYEPDSFVPLARIESGEGIGNYVPFTAHIREIPDWQLSTVGKDPNTHVKAWQAHLDDEREQYHRQQWEQRLTGAEVESGNDSIFYYQCDHLGTPLELLNEDGEVAWAVRYRAWGRVFRVLGHKVEQPLRFQGQYQDQETGLHYNRHRYYDPDAGRFVTQDPIGLAGGVNVYQYTQNPVLWIDALGLTAEKLAVALRRDGRPVGPGQTPHHIVKENCKTNKHVQNSREILQANRIDIDSAPNGAVLWGSSNSQVSMPGHPGRAGAKQLGNYHAGEHIHGALNDKLIYKILKNAERKGVNMESILRDIGSRMESGSWQYTFFCCCDK